MRSMLVLLAACDASVERLPLRTECPEHDFVKVAVDGLALCGRAELTNYSVDGNDHVAVVATPIAGDGLSYHVVIGIGPERRARWIDDSPELRSDKSAIHTGPFIDLEVYPAINLNVPGQHERWWLHASGGTVNVRFDPMTGESHGAFEAVFQVHSEPKRVMHAIGTFVTSGPEAAVRWAVPVFYGQ